jgi:hypothetical protein
MNMSGSNHYDRCDAALGMNQRIDRRDLSGDPSYTTAIEKGERAARQLLDGALND